MKNKIKKYIASLFLAVLFGVYLTYKTILGGSQNVVTIDTSVPEASIITMDTPSPVVAVVAKNTPPEPITPKESIPTNVSKPKIPKTPQPPVATKVDPVVLVQTPVIYNPPETVSGYVDGTYVGDSVDAFYGDVKVQVNVQGGIITDVIALDSPGHRSQSVRINNRALPKLRLEVISTQDSKIDTISGATYTSAAYKKSLASALSQARA